MDAGLAVRPGLPTFLKCRVVELTMRFQACRHCDVLTRRWAQPEHVRPPHDRTNRRSDMAQTLRNGTDKLTTTLVTDSPRWLSRRSTRRALMVFGASRALMKEDVTWPEHTPPCESAPSARRPAG